MVRDACIVVLIQAHLINNVFIFDERVYLVQTYTRSYYN